MVYFCVEERPRVFARPLCVLSLLQYHLALCVVPQTFGPSVGDWKGAPHLSRLERLFVS